LVQLQQSFGSAALRRKGNDDGAIMTKVIVPTLRAGIKERHNLASLRIKCRNMTALEPITLGTRISEVIGFGGATMFFCNHMIDFMHKNSIVGMNQAILTAFLGSKYHQGA
jgi:hypothetical protein